MSLIPGSGRYPGGRHGNPLQYLCLEDTGWTEDPGEPWSRGSQWVGHDWSHLAAAQSTRLQICLFWTFHINRIIILSKSSQPHKTAHCSQWSSTLHHVSVPPYGQVSFHCVDICPRIQQLCVLSVWSPFSVIMNNALMNIYIQVSAWTCLHFFWLHTWEWNWHYSYSTKNHKQFHCPTKNGIMQNKCCLCRRKTTQPYRPCKKKDARALSRFSCVRLCDPMDYSQPGSSVHRDSPGKNTGVGCHALLQGIFPTQGLNLSLLSPALAGGVLYQ